MNARNVHRKVLRVRRLIRAFTLVEMLICVGAVALIAVGLGKLFSSTGDTVKVGKRLSYFNEVATTLENRIRRDLASATRDGPLVIRHKLISSTGVGGGVLLSPEDRNPQPRKRQADELVFLANGKFTSSREPQWPGRAPSSSVARIYFGHGMVRDPLDPIVTPNLTDDPRGTTGPAWPSGLGEPGPNQYASDWILLRHVTVLQRPQTTENGQVPTGGPAGPGAPTVTNWQDSPTQIKLQPAAPTVFRFDPLNLNEPDRLGYGYEYRASAVVAPATRRLPDPNINQWLRYQDTAGWPQFASGLVDVASLDAQMIRTRILGAPYRLPFDTEFKPEFPPKMTITQATRAALESRDYTLANPTNMAHLSKMLMASMLPGADPWIYESAAGGLGGGTLAEPLAPAQGGNKREQRMICAPKPPDFAGTLDPSPADRAAGTPYLPTKPYRQQDQAMLSASNLVVGCSEFKIEWSFGVVYPRIDDPGNQPPNATLNSRVGQLIWHGRESVNATPGEFATAPYRGSFQHDGIIAATGQQSAGYDAYYQRWVPSSTGVSKRRTGAAGVLPFPARLVHWPLTVMDPSYDPPEPDDIPLYSFFGYIDPTFTPSIVNGVQVDPDTLEWPWPKLLRFTIGLTDPTDPTFEQTYQFIVEVPAANTRQ